MSEVTVASVAELLERTARGQPDALAVVADGRTWTYAELWGAACDAAGSLQRAGLTAGDLVLIALANGDGFLRAFFGTLIAGGVAVPVFPRSSPQRLDQIRRLAGASALVVPDAEMAARAASSARGEAIVLTVPDLAAGGQLARVPGDVDRPCYVQFTSGSTADPRGVVITHRNLLANIAQMTAAMDITPDDVFVSWLPAYHDMGLTLMTLTPISLGAPLVVLPTDLRDVEGWLRAIARHRGTFTAGPDFAYRLCVRNVREPGRFDLSSLKVCMDAAEPVRASTLSAFEAGFGLRHVMMAGYGLAEATLSVTCTQRGRPIDVDERGLVCLGRPMPGTTVGIAGPDLLPADQTGEIVVAGPATCAGYHRNPAATTALTWRDDYIRTGDLGYLDPVGRLFFVARQKDVIKIAGRTLYPQEVESLVDEVAGVRLSAAVGVNVGSLEGEHLHVVAEVRDADSASEQDLRFVAIEIVRAVHAALGVRPRSTLLVRPRRLPLTSNGKLQRGVLRDMLLDGRLIPGDEVLYPLPVRPGPGA
jgi:acyl-CoA synthetase (AMP-forming)/AMP-acid ligase II